MAWCSRTRNGERLIGEARKSVAGNVNVGSFNWRKATFPYPGVIALSVRPEKSLQCLPPEQFFFISERVARRPARVRTRLHTNVCVHAARLGHRQSDKFALSPNRPRSRYRSGNAFPDTGEIVLQIVEESALFFPPPPTLPLSCTPLPWYRPTISYRPNDFWLETNDAYRCKWTYDKFRDLSSRDADNGIVPLLQGILSSPRPICFHIGRS